MLSNIDGLCAERDRLKKERLFQRKNVGRASALICASLPNGATTTPTTPWIKALAEVRRLAPREDWCYHHVQDNVTINNLLPERFDTDRQHQMAKAAMARENISYEEARARQIESIPARRLGDPKEFGATCAFLCSALAGFTSGQNLHLDGGSYPALI